MPGRHQCSASSGGIVCGGTSASASAGIGTVAAAATEAQLPTIVVTLSKQLADIIDVLNKKHDVITPTPAALGEDLLASIARNHREREFPKEGESVLTEEENHRLQSTNDEHALIVALTSRFEALFDGFAVMNSGRFPWLFPGHALQKPVLFVCPVSFYQQRTPNNATMKQYPEQYRYGVVDDVRMYDGVVLLDCSLSCTRPAAFGELSIHLDRLGGKLKGPTRGMLFGVRDFWLYEQEKGVPIRLTRGQWIDVGSKEVIRSFFEKTLAPFRHINHLCDALHVRILDPKHDGGTSGFLGQGDFGRVIRVLSKEGRDGLAMKFVMKPILNQGDDEFELRSDYRGLLEHSQSCGCSLVARPTSNVTATSELCGFVMSPVGITCTRALVFENKKPSLTEVLMALRVLHGHHPSILHGNPRLPNLIVTPEGLTWIDVRGSVQNSTCIVAADFAAEMNTLIVSLFPKLKPRVDAGLQLPVDSYGEQRDEASIHELVRYLEGTATEWGSTEMK